MIGKNLTLQLTLVLTIVLIGLVGLGLVIATEVSYSKLVYEYQRRAGSELLELKSGDMVLRLIENQKELGFRLQSEYDFSSAVRRGNTDEMVFWLDQEFNRYFVTIGLLKLEKIIIYDTGLQMLAASARGVGMANPARPPCHALVEAVAVMPVTERIKPHSEICLFDGRPLLSTIISIGTLRSSGYMQIVSDPAHMLARLESELGRYIRITSKDGNILHQSANWPLHHDIRDYIVSSRAIASSSGATALVVHSASSIEALGESLAATRNRATITAMVLVSLVVAGAIILLHHGLRPLKQLRAAADSIGKSDFVPVEEGGFPEIAAPIRSFNRITGEIRTLIQKLRQDVTEHQQTERMLIAARDGAERHAATAEGRRYFCELTLHAIVHGVVTTDTSGFITFMNPMAERLTGWQSDEAMGRPLQQVMLAINGNSRRRINDPVEGIEQISVLDEPTAALLVRKDSSVETPVEYVAAPMRDRNDDIAGIVVIIHDVSEQRSLNRQLTFQSTHDALTGLVNRCEFERRIRSLLTSTTDADSSCALCHLDLDPFKRVNDTCGHAAGDELLKQVTLLLQDRVHDPDTLARLGGDAFGLLVQSGDIRQARRIATDLVETIGSFNFSWREYNFTIGLSIGIVAITGEPASCAELLRHAESACSLAKESGRNQVRVYAGDDDRRIRQQRELHWISRINHALEDGRFELCFQAIAPLKAQSEELGGRGEILLRMLDKSGRHVSPDAFLSAAERCNMIIKIDEWVVDRAMAWLTQYRQDVVISINLSGKSVSSGDFLNHVVSKINQHAIKPELLCFEITETAAISRLSNAAQFITALKKLGCSFALDDFGSGLSSFSYLASLPVDFLKIDGTFVVDIDKDPMHFALVKSINDLGQAMGIRTIAEFAASESIVDRLRDIGVDYAQGYFIDRPRPLIADRPLHDPAKAYSQPGGASNIRRFPGNPC